MTEPSGTWWNILGPVTSQSMDLGPYSIFCMLTVLIMEACVEDGLDARVGSHGARLPFTT